MAKGMKCGALQNTWPEFSGKIEDLFLGRVIHLKITIQRYLYESLILKIWFTCRLQNLEIQEQGREQGMHTIYRRNHSSLQNKFKCIF